MKNLLILSLILIMGVMACSKKTPTGSAPPPSDNTTCNDASCPLKHPEAGAPTEAVNNVIQTDNWQFTLPGSGWTSVQPPDDVIKFIFVNKGTGTVVFFAKDPTTQTSSEYIINALRSFKAAGSTILSAKQVTINGTKMIMVTAQGEVRKVWTWLTVQKGFGYLFTCAVDSEDAGDAVERCQSIADTIQIR